MTTIYYANNLRRFRKKRNLRQKDVAEYLGIKNICEISRWEHGRGLPNFLNLIKLTLLYHTSVQRLYRPLIKQIERENKK